MYIFCNLSLFDSLTLPQKIVGKASYSALNTGILTSPGANVGIEDFMSRAVLSNIVSLFGADYSLLYASELSSSALSTSATVSCMFVSYTLSSVP